MTAFYDQTVWIVEVSTDALSAALMVVILVAYRSCLRKRLSFAFQILMVLFINELGASVSRLLHFVLMDNNIICSLSLILATGFDAAASTTCVHRRHLDVLHCACRR